MIKWMNICTSLAVQKCSALLGLLQLVTISCFCSQPFQAFTHAALTPPCCGWEDVGVDSGHPSTKQQWCRPILVRPESKQTWQTMWEGEPWSVTQPAAPPLLTLSTDAAHTAPDDSATAAGSGLAHAQPLHRCSGAVVGSRHTGPAPKTWGSWCATLSPTSLVPWPVHNPMSSMPGWTVTLGPVLAAKWLLLLEISWCFGFSNGSVKIDLHHFGIQMPFCFAKVHFCGAFCDAILLTGNTAMATFCIVLFCMLFVCSVALLFLLGCQYQCKWLTGKTRLQNDL